MLSIVLYIVTYTPSSLALSSIDVLYYVDLYSYYNYNRTIWFAKETGVGWGGGEQYSE